MPPFMGCVHCTRLPIHRGEGHSWAATASGWISNVRFLDHDPDQHLGANRASEVKEHPFFRGVDWDNLTLQKAIFVPQRESVDDTSYFVSRYNSIGLQNDGDSSDTISDASDSCSSSGLEECAKANVYTQHQALEYLEKQDSWRCIHRGGVPHCV